MWIIQSDIIKNDTVILNTLEIMKLLFKKPGGADR
jgi:hypothetical protein